MKGASTGGKNEQSAEAKAVGTRPRPGAGPRRMRRVLLVDDDLNDLLRYSAILQHEGYEVRSMASHKEAAACLNSERFDLIIVSQGTAAFEERPVIAQAFASNRKAPVIVLSRSSDVACHLEAMGMGPVEYLEKPVAASDLSVLVAKRLGLSKTWVA